MPALDYMGMLPKAYFRADGNSKIGYGHVIRTLALADMMREEFRCIFLIQEPNEWLLNEIREICVDFIELPVNEIFEKEAEFINSTILNEGDFIIIDGYHFTTSYQQILLGSNSKIICIDDLHNQHFLSDVVVNHAGGISELDYSTEAFTRLALGPEYAMLRRPFRQSIANERFFSSIEAIFVCFGGADDHHLAYKTVEMCLTIDKIKDIHVVSNDPMIDGIKQKPNRNLKNLFIHKNINADELVSVMERCQIGVCPASNLAYEACAVGLGLITGIHANNQISISRFLASADCALNMGDFRLVENSTLRRSIAEFDSNTANQQVRKQKMIVKDAYPSFSRIFEKLKKEYTIKIRRATIKDLVTYYKWALDPIVRQSSIVQDTFTIENHTEWFNNKLSSESTILYVFEYRKTPFAQVRFELENNAYRINFSIDGDYRGKGFGDVVLKMAIKELSKELMKKPFLTATVKMDNIASSRAFRNNSFILNSIEEIGGVSYEIYQK
jgi:UDP-2,4-diacetamido-2,4,6-trideoxy-beta-L-altropyranose hydrolase